MRRADVALVSLHDVQSSNDCSQSRLVYGALCCVASPGSAPCQDGGGVSYYYEYVPPPHAGATASPAGGPQWENDDIHFLQEDELLEISLSILCVRFGAPLRGVLRFVGVGWRKGFRRKS